MWRCLTLSSASLLDFMRRGSIFSYSMIVSCGVGGGLKIFEVSKPLEDIPVYGDFPEF